MCAGTCGAVNARTSGKKVGQKQKRKALMGNASDWDLYVHANVDGQVKHLMANSKGR